MLVGVSLPTDSLVLEACSPISSHQCGGRSGDFQPAAGEGGDSAAGVSPAGITHYDMLTGALLLHAEVTIGRHIESDDEWNIVVIRGGRHIGAGVKVRCAIVSARGRTPAEELHALRHDFGAVTLAAAVAGLVLATGDAAFDVSLAALLEIAPAGLSQLSPDDDVVPLGLFRGIGRRDR